MIAYMFDKRGIIVLDQAKCSEEKAMDIGIEAGADDINLDNQSRQGTAKNMVLEIADIPVFYFLIMYPMRPGKPNATSP